MADLDKFSYHEALDRAHVANDHFHEYVESHVVVQHHKELKNLAEEVTAKMYNFYNMVASYIDKSDDSGL